MILDFIFPLLQTEYYERSSTGSVLFGTGFMLFFLAIMIVTIVGMWKSFEKAGQPGWASIIPFYNLYVVTQIAKKPGYWVLLCLIPIVNIIVIIMLYMAFAKQYGKDEGFGIGLAFLSFIFWPILGFGSAQYIGGDLHNDVQNFGGNVGS